MRMLPAGTGSGFAVSCPHHRVNHHIRHSRAVLSAFNVSGSVSKLAGARSIFATITFAGSPASTKLSTCSFVSGLPVFCGPLLPLLPL
jgi:hypothetical protein